MKPWYCIALFAIIFAFASCDEEFPSLKIVNESDNYTINSVSLVGYNFQSLFITSGGSQTFVLDMGMPSGNSNINVNVTVGGGGVSRVVRKDVNFTDGGTTTITLKGCGTSTGCFLE